MPRIQKILETKAILAYLISRGLIKQYQKAKQFLLQGNTLQVHFKERNPQGCAIWSFRINKQFRALGKFDEEDDLIIFKIDNHQ